MDEAVLLEVIRRFEAVYHMAPTLSELAARLHVRRAALRGGLARLVAAGRPREAVCVDGPRGAHEWAVVAQ